MKSMLNSWKVFLQFFSLGWFSFGGPAAHIGYFRRHFVEQKQWLSSDQYGQMIALSQLLPGPGSSQVGFMLGLHRAGIGGGIAAFLGFTLPSFLIMYGLTQMESRFEQSMHLQGLIDGLKLFAVVVVIDAIWQMGKSFSRTLATFLITLGAALLILSFPSLMMQMLVILIAAFIHWSVQRADRRFADRNGPSQSTSEDNNHDSSLSANSINTNDSINTNNVIKTSNTGKWWSALFLVLFVVSITLSLLPELTSHGLVISFFQFFQVGSLVFGGGHVVLPLLQNTLVIDSNTFLTGYAAAQGVPGPMFTLATYLGSELHPNATLLGATLATLGIFLPGFLLVLAVRDFWKRWLQRPGFVAAVAGVNAAVVGLLVAALINPIWSTGVQYVWQWPVILMALFALNRFKIKIIWLVILFMLIGWSSHWVYS